MRILHAIHDFLPRHRAGSEIYAFELARESSRRADVFVLAAEYDPSTPHGTIRWRSYEGLPVIEIVNNWDFPDLKATYSSERINAQIEHVLDATCPDVVHVHNLLNLSFDLPRLAQQRGIRTVATLHDYTLVCPSGGQRVHVAESHVCASIEAERCARCFGQSALARQMRAASAARSVPGRLAVRAAHAAFKMAPLAVSKLLNSVNGADATAGDIRRRLAYARQVFESIDIFVAPSGFIADEFCTLGIARDRVEVSDYGFRQTESVVHRRQTNADRLRIGFVGTLVWHKGVHVLIDAVRRLRGQFDVWVHGDTTVFPDYVAALRQSGAGAPVVFSDGFDRDRVADVYSDLDVLVVPSLWPENSPLVIHEAFMHGVPVVAARGGGIPELVVHELNGLLYEPFDAGALAASLQRLIDAPHLLAELSARLPVVKSIAQDAREWEERYRSLCPEPMAGAHAGT